MNELGFKDCRIINKTAISINDPEIQKKVNKTKYYSITYRCYKIDDLEDRC